MNLNSRTDSFTRTFAGFCEGTFIGSYMETCLGKEPLHASIQVCFTGKYAAQTAYDGSCTDLFVVCSIYSLFPFGSCERFQYRNLHRNVNSFICSFRKNLSGILWRNIHRFPYKNLFRKGTFTCICTGWFYRKICRPNCLWRILYRFLCC